MSVLSTFQSFYDGMPFTILLIAFLVFCLQRCDLPFRIVRVRSEELSWEERVAAKRAQWAYEDSVLRGEKMDDEGDGAEGEDEGGGNGEDGGDGEGRGRGEEGSEGESESESESAGEGLDSESLDLDTRRYLLRKRCEVEILDVQIPLEDARFSHHLKLCSLDPLHPALTRYPSGQVTMMFEVEDLIDCHGDIDVVAGKLARMIRGKREAAEEEMQRMRAEMEEVEERLQRGRKAEREGQEGDEVVAVAFEAVREWRLRCEAEIHPPLHTGLSHPTESSESSHSSFNDAASGERRATTESSSESDFEMVGIDN